jgi:SOS-response transcriptional repressor LexA
MNPLGKNLAELLLRKKMTQAQLSEKSGVDTATINRALKGRYEMIRPTLKDIAEALDVSPAQLIAPNLTFDPNVVVDEVKGRRIPVLDYVQAVQYQKAVEQFRDSDSDDFILTYGEYSKMSFALRIRGDSMTPRFRDGDMIIIDPAVKPRPGNFVVAVTEHSPEVIFRQYRDAGLNEKGSPVFELSPLNPNYAPMRSDRQLIAIIGTAMHRLEDLTSSQ